MSDSSYNLPQEEINFEKFFKLIWRNLWLFIVCVLIALSITFLYNRYTIPIYKVSASILIKENNSQPLTQGTDNMFSGSIFGGIQNLQNELIIIQSFPVISKAISNLDLEVEYYEFKNHQYHNTYAKTPFTIVFFKEHPQIIGTIFNLHFNSDGSFNLVIEKSNALVYDYQNQSKVDGLEDFNLNLKGNLGEVIETENFKFIVQLTDDKFSDFDVNKRFAFKLQTNYSLTQRYSNALNFSIVDKKATVIELTLSTSSVNLGKDILNEVIHVYSVSNLAEKNHIANMTIGYIDSQLQEVSRSLNLTEDSLQRFLSKNQLVDVEDQGASFSAQLLELQNSMAELVTQKRYFNYVANYLENNDEETQIIAPSSMGIEDPLLNKLIMDLSTAQSTRDNLIQNNQERNPIVQRLSIQINNLKSVVAENMTSAKSSNEMSIEELQKRISQLEREIRKLPKTQLQLGGIQRSYQLNDAIYNYLLQKHAEAKITKASNLPDNIVVAPANMVGGGPIAPNKNRNYIMALFFGIALPFGFLSVIMILKRKVEVREDLEKITNAPILGTILHSRKKKEINVFKDRPQSNIAESYRSLRTNINFFLNNEKTKTILLTSTVAGEGKSFNALNIAASYAGLGHKTILVNYDIRKATQIIETKNRKIGLSTFLAGKNTITDIISDGNIENLSYIGPGPIAPNPMELIATSKTSDLLDYLKDNYDCIILDGTPLAQVTDSYNLVQFADLCLLITRHKYTSKKILKLVLKDLKQKNINNIGLVLNDNRIVSEQYGYGYGYYEK